MRLTRRQIDVMCECLDAVRLHLETHGQDVRRGLHEWADAQTYWDWPTIRHVLHAAIDEITRKDLTVAVIG